MSSQAASYTTPEGWRQTQRPLKQGTLLRSSGWPIPPTDAKTLAELVEEAKSKATKAIWIRLSVADLERAQRIAAQQGVGYQTVLKRAIREGLENLP